MTQFSPPQPWPDAQFPPADGRLGIVSIGDLKLENDAVLPGVRLAVQRWGEMSPGRDNVILVEHALTADSHLVGPADDEHPTPGWWSDAVGPGAPLDTDRWCVLAINILGGCRGSTGPSSLAPDGAPWGSRFPELTVGDQVAAERALADMFGIDRFAAVVGGSLGGMRVLEWIVGSPDRVGAALILAIGARATADQIGNQTAQVAVVTSDPDWQGGDYYGTGRAPTTGLGLARRIAHLTYRTESDLDQRFRNLTQDGEAPWHGGQFAVESYLSYQAEKLISRFDAGSYVALLNSVNRYDIGRGRGGVAAALASTPVPTVVAGIDSDRYCPLRLVRELADGLPGCSGLRIVTSKDGHDGFLTENHQVAELLQETLRLTLTPPNPRSPH